MFFYLNQFKLDFIVFTEFIELIELIDISDILMTDINCIDGVFF